MKARPGNIQSIVVEKIPGLTIDKAKEKAIESGAHPPIPNNLIDETPTSFRFRQRNPSDFIKGSFRSFKNRVQGVTIIYGKLKEGKMSEFRFIPVLLSEENIPKKIQLLRVGNFVHDGREIKVSNLDLKSMVKNFSEKIRGIDLMIDFSHNSEGEAAGWINQLALSDSGDQLWAEVDWTPTGKKCLENKSFKYISADFSFNYKDNEKRNDHGPTLFGAGLTNRPVVKEMSPIVLSEGINQLSEVDKMNEEKKEEKKEEVKLTEMNEALDENEGYDSLEDQLQALKDELLKKDEELIALRGKLEASEKEKEERLAEMEKEKVLVEKNKAFDLKLSEGLVVEAQRTPFIDGDMDKFLSLQHEIKLSESGNSGTINETISKENFEEKIIALAEKRSEENKIPLDVAIGIELNENKEIMKHYNSIA
jgi:phage I-like protein